MRRLVIAGMALVVTMGYPSAQSTPADLVLQNGNILTVDARDSIAQAVAIVGGRIVAVGRTDDMRVRIGAATQVIDLRGRTVTPGFIDTHVHFSEVDALFSVDLSDVSVTKMDDVLKLAS